MNVGGVETRRRIPGVERDFVGDRPVTEPTRVSIAWPTNIELLARFSSFLRPDFRIGRKYTGSAKMAKREHEDDNGPEAKRRRGSTSDVDMSDPVAEASVEDVKAQGMQLWLAVKDGVNKE